MKKEVTDKITPCVTAAMSILNLMTYWPIISVRVTGEGKEGKEGKGEGLR